MLLQTLGILSIWVKTKRKNTLQENTRSKKLNSPWPFWPCYNTLQHISSSLSKSLCACPWKIQHMIHWVHCTLHGPTCGTCLSKFQLLVANCLHHMMAAHLRFSPSVAAIDLNNGTHTGNGTIRQVLVTPVVAGVRATCIPSPQAMATCQPPKVFLIGKVWKRFWKGTQRMLRLFTLHHIDTTQV